MKILVGFPPGGSVDVVARLLADDMRSSLDQNVIVDNKPGAAGRVASASCKRAAPDGNTLTLAPSGALVILPWLFKNVGYDPARDFTPIARVTTFDFAITVGPAAPPGDFKALLAWLKANPNKANFATSGAGTVPHFTGVLLAQETRRSAHACRLQGRRARRAGPPWRPGADDGRHSVGDDRAPSRRQAPDRRGHRRQPLGRPARGADAEGDRDQRRRRRVLRVVRAGEHAGRPGPEDQRAVAKTLATPRFRRRSAPSR